MWILTTKTADILIQGDFLQLARTSAERKEENLMCWEADTILEIHDVLFQGQARI